VNGDIDDRLRSSCTEPLGGNRRQGSNASRRLQHD
jgi:hypothetical protein